MVGERAFEIVWDRKALVHLSDILDYLSKSSEAAPRIVKKAIFDRLDQISTNPFLCEPDSLKDPKSKDFRAFVVFSYRVTYQVVLTKKQIRVLRVRHTSREPVGY